MKNPLNTPDANGETLGEALLAAVGCLFLAPLAYGGIVLMITSLCLEMPQ